jgi:hypothetical protein
MRMAKEIGFFIIPIERQYVHQVEEDALIEIRAELGLSDLVQQEEVDPRLERFFRTHLPKVIERTADDWSASGPDLIDYWSMLATERDAAIRAAILVELRSTFEAYYGSYPSGW